VPHEQPRVRLPGRPEILLDAQVQLDPMTTEPAAPAGGQGGRLRDLGQPEHAVIEGTQPVFASRRAGQLDMMNHEPSG